MSWKRTLVARQPTVLSVTRTWTVSVLESVLPVEVASIEAALAASIVRSRPAMATLLRRNASAVLWTWLPTNAPPAASVCATVVELSSATSRAVSSARTVMSRPLTRAATTEASAAPRTSLRATTP